MIYKDETQMLIKSLEHDKFNIEVFSRLDNLPCSINVTDKFLDGRIEIGEVSNPGSTNFHYWMTSTDGFQTMRFEQWQELTEVLYFVTHCHRDSKGEQIV